MTDDIAGVPRLDDLLRVWREPDTGAGTVVVGVAGEVDLSSAPRLERFLEEIAGTAPGRLVVDLTAVTFLSSVGLSLLVAYDERMRDAGGRLRVVTGNRTVARAISMTGLGDVLTVFATLDDATSASS